MQSHHKTACILLPITAKNVVVGSTITSDGYGGNTNIYIKFETNNLLTGRLYYSGTHSYNTFR